MRTVKWIMAVATGPRRRPPYARLAAVAMVVVTGAAIVVWQAGGTEGDDAASCVAPQLLVNPPPGELPRPGQTSGLAVPVSRGQTIDVVGRYYFADCFDVLMQGETPRTQDAEQSVPITLLDDDAGSSAHGHPTRTRTTTRRSWSRRSAHHLLNSGTVGAAS